MLTIRELNSTDHDEVRSHLARSWRETYTKIIGAVQVEEMAASLDRPDLGMLAPDGIALVAVENSVGSPSTAIGDCLVGTAIAAERHGVGYIWGMYVAPEKKRCGIGGKLINEISRLLPSVQQFSVVVLKSSSDADAFYQALGFSPTATVDHELSAGKNVPAMTMVWNRIGK
ncbi:MAG: GNAT family N-acetyltransferase [Paracoccaceae bacterium]